MADTDGYKILSTNVDIIKSMYIKEQCRFPCEQDDTTNIEYKLRLDKKDKGSLNKMITQMTKRMNRGYVDNGIYDAHYLIGIHDNGVLSRLTKKQVIHSYNILKKVIKRAGATEVSRSIYCFEIDPTKIVVDDHPKRPCKASRCCGSYSTDPYEAFMIHVHIKKDRHIDIHELNIVLAGQLDSTKTSIMSNLVFDKSDDGNGNSRNICLKHPHDKSTGSTTDIKYETIGTDYECLINYGMYDTLESIHKESSALLNIIDMPSIEHNNAICHSMMSLQPDIIVLCIAIDSDYTVYSKDCDFIANYTAIPHTNCKVIVAITKSDTVDKDDTIRDKIMTKLMSYNYMFQCESFVYVNNIYADGIQSLTDEIIKLSNTEYHADYDLMHNSIETPCFVVNEVFTIPNTGKIYHGMIMGNTEFDVNSDVYVTSYGNTVKNKIKSIHYKGSYTDKVSTGSSCSMMLNLNTKLDKTCIVSKKQPIVKNNFSVNKLTNKYIKNGRYTLFAYNSIVTCEIMTMDDGSRIAILDTPIPILSNNGKVFGLIKNDEMHFIMLE
jgi:GTPase